MQLHLRQQLSSLFMNSSLSNKASDLPDLLHASISKVPQEECNHLFSNSQPVPLIAPVVSQSDFSSLITTILEQASLSRSEINIEIVTSLLQNKMPVSKTMIQSILTSHRNNKDIPIDVLVLSKKQDCVITEKATTELLRFTSSETSIPNELEQLTKEFLTLLQHPESFETKKDYMTYRNTVMTFIAEKSSSPLPEKNAPSTLKEPDLNKIPSFEKNNLTTTFITKETVPAVTAPAFPTPIEHMTQQTTYVTPPPFTQKDSATISHILDLPFKKTVEDLFLELFSVSPNQLKKPDSAFQQFHSVTEQLNELILKTESNLLKETKERIKVQYESIKQATSDIPVIPEHCTYIQLPIRLKEQIVHSDLYFITNKKKATSDSSSVTVLLHLNLEHLKNLDICLHLNSHHISASFYSESDMISKLLNDHVNQLSDCLNQAGMILNSHFFVRTKQQTVLSQLNDKKESPVKMNPLSFDIRT